MSILTPFFNLIKPQKTDRIKAADMASNFDTIDTEMHRPPLTVNGILPNPSTRNIAIESVPLADNLSSDEAQFNQGTFLVRMSGGGAPISGGIASLSTIKGNMVKTGYIPESIAMTVNAVPRVAPAAITATLDAETFEAYVETAGTYTLTYLDSWSADPADYGVTVSNTPVSGDEIVIVWDGESEPEMTVNAVERPVPAAITATLDRDTFVAYVATSGTVTLSYTSSWSANPALYGITVENTPVSGDSIVVVYVKENRGTITPANISAFNSTGWNLYDNVKGYAMVVKYSDDYGFLIGGNYSLVNFATTPTGTQSAVNVDANGYFNVSEDGYIIVTGGDATTYILATWSDWTEGYEGEFESYSVDTIDMSEIMLNFSAGLCAIGDVRDEINFNTQLAISRINRLAYTSENLEAVIASGMQYDTDTNYIYVVRQNPVETSFSVDGSYTVSDHGIEFYTTTSTTPPVTEAIYGDNLKDKLRTDVLTISQQTLSSGQKAQVRTNIGAASAQDVATQFGEIESGVAIVIDGDTAPKAIANGKYLFIKNHSTLATGGYHATADIALNASITSSNVAADTDGIVNAAYSALNSKISNYDYTFTDTDLFVKCRNGVVFIRTGDNCTNTMLGSVTLPSAYRYAYNAGYPCMYYNGSTYVNGFINIGTDGKLSLKDSGYSDATSTHIRAAITYVL